MMSAVPATVLSKASVQSDDDRDDGPETGQLCGYYGGDEQEKSAPRSTLYELHYGVHERRQYTQIAQRSRVFDGCHWSVLRNGLQR